MLRVQASLKGKPVYHDYLCQCRRCLDTFSVNVTQRNGRIVEVEPHPHIARRGHGQGLSHACGGTLVLFKF